MIREAEVDRVLALLPDGCFLKHYCDYARTQVASHLFYHVGIAFSLVGAVSPSGLVGKGFKAATYANMYALICGKSGQAEKSLALGIAQDIMSVAAPDLVGPDPTSDQALSKILEAHPSLWFPYSEGGKFLSMTAGAQNQLGQGLRKGFTDAFDGRSYTREYSKGQKVDVKHPRPAIALACTPQDLEDSTIELDWKGGFVSRFMFCFGEAERSVEEPLDDEWTARMREWLSAWIASSVPRMCVGTCTGMTPEARQRWRAWSQEILTRHERELQHERLVGIINRTRLMAAKMATSLHYQCGYGWARVHLEEEDPWQIQDALLEAAIGFAEIHLKSGLALAERISPNWEMREMNRLLMAIGVDWTPFGDSVRAADLTVRKAKIYVETLMEQGRVAHEQQGTTNYYRQVPDGTAPAWDPGLVLPTAPVPAGLSNDAAVAPVPSVRFHYSNTVTQGEYGIPDIAGFIRQDPHGHHHVWQSGWMEWRPWGDVPEIAALVV